MFPGMNMDPKKMKKAMKQMGINTEEIEADEVVIKKSNGNIVINNPQVSKVKMQGQEIFQVQGDASEESKEDIKTVMEQTSCSEEDAKKALEETGDIAKAIMKLQK